MNNDLISRSALLDRLTTERFMHYTMHTDTASLVQHDQEFNACMGIVFDFPAVDAEVVQHGRWEHGMQCSYCKQIDLTKPNYCPNCGCKMDGDVNA